MDSSIATKYTFTSRNKWWTKLLRTTTVVFATVLILAFVIFNIPELNGSLTWKDLTEVNIGSLIASLIFISLALQSTLEVFVSNFRAYEKSKLVIAHKDNTLKFQRLEEEWNNISQAFRQDIHANITNIPEALATIKKELQISKSSLLTIESELNIYRTETKNIANFAGLLAGIIVSLGGLRVLQPFVIEIDGIDQLQICVFHTIDVLLTAGLISGGSDGVNRLTDIYKSFTSFASLQAGVPSNSNRMVTQEPLNHAINQTPSADN